MGNVQPGADRAEANSREALHGGGGGPLTEVSLCMFSEGDNETAHAQCHPEGIGETYHSWELGVGNVFNVAKDVERCHDFALGINQ